MSSGGTVEAKENSQEDVLANKLDDGLASKPTTLWEYEHAAGKWVRYDDDLTEKLNKLTEDSLEIEMEEARLRLDLAAMKQLNLETGFKRNLRCVVRQDDNSSFSCWEIKKGRRYEPLSRDLQIIFEQAVTAKVTSIDYNGDKCDVDFETMEIVVKDVVTKFRRSVSLAESSFSAAPVLPARRTRALVKRSLNVDAMASTQLEEEDKEEEEDELPKKTRKSKVASGASTSKKSGSGRVYDPKRTMILKGRAPVDVECRQKMDEAHVYEEGNLVWDAMLNQTNVGNNNNKFYILQLLKDDETNNFSVWFRWGRVGYPGQNSLTPFGGNLEGAKHCFTTKFHDKTGNDWADKDNFETLPRKYTLIHMDYSVKRDEAPEEDIEAEDAQGKSPPPESKLDKRIQELLKLICNIQAMEETAMQLEFDSTRSPLGKLTRHQIAEGYRILGELEKQIREKKFGGEFVYLVNEYYTKIPHNFGFQQPPLIKTVEMLKKETDLLQVLEDIEIAVKSFGEAKKTGEKLSTVDKYYKNLHCDVSPVEKGSSDHQMIEKYMKLTHGDTHMYSMKITNIYQIERHTETERFKKDIGNRKLLWHGSRTTNFYGILSQGLRIAPPEAPVCGYMFGKGIYFADMASKSGNYCFPAPGKPGLLLLCEVALGESNELYQSDYHADKLPAGKHSTKGIGRTYPNEKEYFELEDGTVVPCGKPTQFKSSTANCSLLYNEYIVYSVEQVRIRYLVEVEFDM